MKLFKLFFLILFVAACENESKRELPIDYVGYWYEINQQDPANPNFYNEENILYIYENGENISYILKINDNIQTGDVKGSGFDIILSSDEGGFLSLSTIYSIDPIKDNGIAISIEDVVSDIIAEMQSDEILHPYVLQDKISELMNMADPR